ncbi:hypothetical protein DDI_0328 [Dickeya dianthicola RNS04.9]|nr:hypothetical protein DDI_0328 [Dickeya dianthicola RNS04.9]
MLRFQRDVLTVNDGVFHAIEQKFNSPLFLWVWHYVENISAALLSAHQ